VKKAPREIIPPAVGKHVCYDPGTHDYAAFYNGELLGYCQTRPEAENLADDHVYQLSRRQTVPADDLATCGEVL
jgi:hypothetical protein